MASSKNKFKESARSKASRLDPKVAKKRKKYEKAERKRIAKPGKRTATKAAKAANRLIKTTGKRAKKY